MSVPITKQEAKQLYEENIAYIYRSALFLTKSKELAEDISQEVFLKAFDKYHTFNQTKPIKPWLYQIMLNLTRTEYRKKIKYVTLDDMNDLPNDDTFTEQLVLKSEEDKALWLQINKLRPKLREVLVCHFYLDMTLDEVAKILNIPLGTCKSRLNAALKKLRKDEAIQEFTCIIGGHEL